MINHTHKKDASLPSTRDREDSFVQFFGHRVVVRLTKEKMFDARLAAVTPTESVFEADRWMRSIYARLFVHPIIDSEVV
jgi:hypothetical protein